MYSLISTSDWLRIVLLYSHLILCTFAISAVLRTDIRLLLGTISQESLKNTAHAISGILAGLWVTGLAIIYLDTGFSPEILLTKSKLLLKLMCVVTLTLNGMVLHHISFPLLTRSDKGLRLKESVLLVVTGGLSTSHWMLAAFIGMSKPLGRLPADTLFMGYGAMVLLVVLSSLLCIPLLPAQLASVEPEPA